MNHFCGMLQRDGRAPDPAQLSDIARIMAGAAAPPISSDRGAALWQRDAVWRSGDGKLRLAGDLRLDNGNTLRKVNDITDQLLTEYDWDYENRLVAADTNGDGATDVAYRYDANGIRVSSTAGGEETRFLIDANRPYAQVLEEYEEDTLAATYIYGDDLISQNQGDLSYYLYAAGRYEEAIDEMQRARLMRPLTGSSIDALPGFALIKLGR